VEGNLTQPDLTQRQRAILRGVVEEYVASRQPVGSRTLVTRVELDVSPSTVRSELAELERLGLLTHPHTSAGRVPTEQGYRYYADRLLERLDPQPGGFPLDLTAARNEVDAALQKTTEMLSELTRLLALVSAPPLGTATVRHVEVLLLQPHVVMVVVITSTGSVTKRIFSFGEPVDPGLVYWATQYLNDRVAGLELGSSRLRRRLDEPALGSRESAFVAALRMGYAGVQCGTRFIATRECDASEAYKAAILATDASGIVLTERLTGVPLAVIDTPAVRRMGLHANALERWLLKNPRTKHALRMLLTVRSAWSLRRGARVDRSQLWQAGKSVAGIHSIEPAGAIVRRWASALVAAD